MSCPCPEAEDGARACLADGTYEACDCTAVGVGAVPDPTGEADYLVDFGFVAVGERARAALPIRNTGRAGVTFELRAVAAPFETEADAPAVVEAGERGELAWFLRPTGRDPVSAVTRVASSGGAFTVRLIGEGFYPMLECEPTHLDFGNTVKGTPYTREVTCVNTSEHAWTPVPGPITGEDPGQFAIPPAPDERLGPGEHRVLQVSALSNRSGRAEAVGAADGRVLENTSLASFTLDHAVACQPSMLDFGSVPPGGTAWASIVGTNSSPDPYAVTGVASDPSSNAGVTWTPSDYPVSIPGRVGYDDGSMVIDVVFEARIEDAGRKGGRLVITTDDPTTPRMDIGWVGFVQAASP